MRQDKTSAIFNETIEENYPPVDTSKFQPLNAQELITILGLTIKKDEVNKLITFLAQLSAFTKDSQINLSFNAPSSTGKSYIPLEISALFPEEDVVRLGGASPTAFFHDQGEYDKETNTITVDLARKIIIFLDQPSTALLERLRSLLSHDDKEIKLKITDKNQRGGNRTKNVILLGFPVVIFCTAGLNLDEQEATRFLLLSPEINQEKIREAVLERIKKESNSSDYYKNLESNPDRALLKQRVAAIKESVVTDVRIGSPQLVEQKFFEGAGTLKPRHQRDIGRVISLVKAFALLNMWFRDRDGLSLIANEDDVNQAFSVWGQISEAQELNLPPYVFNLYKEVILKSFESKNSQLGGQGTGLTRQEILQRHFEAYGRFLPVWQLRQQIIPMLETSGLITQESDPLDKRKLLIFPTTNNSELGSGVKNSFETNQTNNA